MASKEFELGPRLKRIQDRMKNPRACLKAIGAIMVAESQLSFKEQKYGKKQWDPRAVPNAYGIIQDFSMGRKTPPPHRFDPIPE